VPDSASLTVADRVHMVALACIFLTLLISAFGLRLEVRGREELAFRIDRWCLLVMPLLFYGWVAWSIFKSAR
jgi:1-acyl-sn-glycerol-3-phosphate acyltransferase